jgi:hypothetical protein
MTARTVGGKAEKGSVWILHFGSAEHIEIDVIDVVAASTLDLAVLPG